MKKSGKKLAIAAILTGAVVVYMQACQHNVALYGPPPMDTDVANEASSEAEAVENNEPTEEPDEYKPEDNMMEDVYGPPADYRGK